MWPAVLAVAALAGVAYGWAADRVSIEMYYAGAVRTMAHDWRAFFFGGFDPAGTVTLDKLPGAFWLQALSVRVFGLSTVALVVPQAAAGVLAVIVLFRAVRRTAGAWAGLLAAVILAATPAAAVASRGNVADGVCVLLLVLAADATLRAVGTGRIRTVVLAGAWIGLAFQVKMLESWAVVPGLALALLIAAPGSVRRRFGVAAIGGGVLVAVSLSWMVAVSLVPAADRPYADGSQHNSVFEQVFVYNGIGRFEASHTVFGLLSGPPYEPSAEAVDYTRDESATASRPGADQTRPGWSRLVSGPVGRNAGWLLPTALAVFVGGLVARGRRPRTDPVRAALLVWGGWLAVFAAALSAAGQLLSYYTDLLAPPVAALCAIGLRMAVAALRGSEHRRRGVAAAVVALVVAGTAGVEVALGAGTPGWFRVTMLAVAVAGVLVLLTGLVAGRPGAHRVAVVGAALAMLVAPATATVTLVADGGGSFDAPYVPDGTLAHPSPHPTTGGVAAYGGVVAQSMDAGAWRRLDSLRDSWRGTTGEILVFGSAHASQFVLAGVPGIVPFGGFTGFVRSPTPDQVARMIEDGTAGWAIVPGQLNLYASDPRVVVVTELCQPVPVVTGAEGIDTAGPVVYHCPGGR